MRGLLLEMNEIPPPARGWIQLDENGRVLHVDTNVQAMLGDDISAIHPTSIHNLLGRKALPANVFVQISADDGNQFLARSHPIRSGGVHIELIQLGDLNRNAPSAEPCPSDARLVAQCINWHLESTRETFYRCPDPISIFGWLNPAMLAANTALCTQFGRTEHSLVGKCNRALTPPEESDVVDRTTLAQHQDGRTQRPFPIATSEGTVWMALTLVRYRYEGEDFQAAMYTSKRNHPSDSLTAVNPAKIMANVDRLNLMGSLVNRVVDQLATPGSSVLGNLTTLGQELGEDHPQQHLIHESLVGIHRISALMNTLRVFGSDQSAPYVPTRVNKVVEEAVALVGNVLRHKAILTLELGNVGEVMGNPSQLMEVVTNLLTNAGQALDPQAPRHFIRVTTFSRHNRAVIEVSDTGAGIPDDLRARIFEPFFTTRPLEEASGLGLAVALQITTQHKGTLAVESSSLGSRFRVCLPQHVVAYKASSTVTSWRPGQCGNRVLVIDDEPMLLRVIKRMLRKTVAIEVANGGQEAIVRLKEVGAFDLVLCDLTMPGVNGHQVYEWIEQNLPEMVPRTHFLSGGAFTKESAAFLRDRNIKVVGKPVESSTLIALVKAHIAPSD